MNKLKIVIKGETINLCRPTKEFAGGDTWYKWLNDPYINRNLDGKYKKIKNTKKKQIAFFNNQKKECREVLIISTKNHVYKGVVSLSKIDNQDKSCDISLITDTKIEPLLAPYAGLEAMALMSDYAFSKLKLKRIDCAFTLVQKSWQQRTELLGYRHFFRSKFRAKTYSSLWYNNIYSMADIEVKDLKNIFYYTSLNFKDFKTIIRTRGKLWDSLKKMRKRISKLPDKSFIDIFNKFLAYDKKIYYDEILKL